MKFKSIRQKVRFNEKRRNNANLYCKLLKHIGEIQLPKIEDGCTPVFHLFIVRAYKRDALKKFLEEKCVGVGIHYPISISKLKCYDNYFEGEYEIAEKNSANILSLPMFPDLTEIEIKKVCSDTNLFCINVSIAFSLSCHLLYLSHCSLQ